jgi:hypothetical protein
LIKEIREFYGHDFKKNPRMKKEVNVFIDGIYAAYTSMRTIEALLRREQRMARRR